MQDKQLVIVSGGSRGLGASICQTLLKEGYAVATFSRSSTPYIERELGNPDFYWQSLDISNTEQLKAFIKDVVEKFGSIYGLVNNAGVGTEGILATTRISDIQATIDINLTSPLVLTRLAIKHMIRKQDGVIINITSVNGVRGHSGLSAYSATKAGLDGLTRSLAREVGRKGIRVNSVSPGFFESDMVGHMDDKAISRIERRTPLGRLGKAEDISSLIHFLINSGSYITGQTIVVDGGFTC